MRMLIEMIIIEMFGALCGAAVNTYELYTTIIMKK